VHDAFDDGTAYRAELSARVDQPVLFDDPILQRDLQLPGSWWADLTKVLEKVSATVTDRVAVRQQYMDRAIPEFVGIPAPAVTCWTTAHADLHWANLTAPLRLLDWEGWGQAPEGFDVAMLYAYSLLQEDVATRVRDAFPVLGSPAGLAAEATVCAQLLQTVARGDNLTLEDQLRDWSEELRRR
jgi:thiamine kinase-like enzyme